MVGELPLAGYRVSAPRLVITGAAGTIGGMLRERLRLPEVEVIWSDRQPLTPPDGHRFEACDLTDLSALRALFKGGGDVLHFGGQATEARFDIIRDANLTGAFNVYEAARLEGVRRILFASSTHAIGFYRRDEAVDRQAAVRPDTLYGVSKVFGEALGRLYHDKHGVEGLALRLGSCFPEPADQRQLATWFSPDDLVSLIHRFVGVERLGFKIAYGVSANREVWWHNGDDLGLDWTPTDTTDRFRDAVLAKEPPPGRDPVAERYQGGIFTSFPAPDGETE